jgi:hypothetical protein
MDRFAAVVNDLQKADQANIATMAVRVPQSIRDTLPGGEATLILPEDALEAWSLARAPAIAAWRAGDYRESLRALQFGQRMLGTVKDAAKTMREKTAGATNLIRQKMSRTPSPIAPRNTEPAMADFRPHLLDATLRKAESSGAILAAADEALCRFDVAKAVTDYREARRVAVLKKESMIAKGNNAEAELQQRLINAVDHRLASLENSRSAAAVLERWVRTVRPQSANEPICDSVVKELTDIIASGAATKQFKESLNPVFEFQTADGKKFVFKHLGFSQDSENEILVEMVGSALAKKLGIPAPSVRRAKLGAIRDVKVLRQK